VGGGHLYLTGGRGYGQFSANAGGNVFVFPGVGTGAAGLPGNVILGHDGANVKGNVGIGVASPSMPLDVRGPLQIRDSVGGPPVGGPVGLLIGSVAGSYKWLQSYENLPLILNPLQNNVGVGVTNPLDRFHVAGDIRIGSSTTGCVKTADGTVITGTCSSDLRFKKNVTPFTNMLDKVARLQPVYFNWRASEFPNKHFGDALSFGLIAQDVEAVLPELVTKDEQGFLAINYSKLPLLTIQAVKELKAENEALKQRNAALESRLETLEQMMRQLTGQQLKQPKQQ
jgi:hypothetical protein